MEGSGWPANSVNSFWKCFSSGSYKFAITDAYGDGICCSYGNGGYSVKVDDKEVASGGQFGSKEEKTFNVVSSTDSPVAPISTTSPTMYPTHTPPTMYPTQSVPTMHPTDSVPTPFPTASTPTSYPTETAPTIKPTIACKAK